MDGSGASWLTIVEAGQLRPHALLVTVSRPRCQPDQGCRGDAGLRITSAHVPVAASLTCSDAAVFSAMALSGSPFAGSPLADSLTVCGGE